MRKAEIYLASAFFVCTWGLQWPTDKFHYFKNNGEAVYKYQYHNWDPSNPLPNTPINDLIVKEHGYVEDFNGTPLTAAAVWKYETHTPQYSFKKGSNGTVFDKGWMVNLLYDLSYMLNFTVKGIQTEEYTVEYPNGTLTGPGGMIVAGEVDLMIGLQYVSSNYQLLALRPIHPLGFYRISAFLLQPKVGGARNIYTQPFRTTAWAVILVIVTGIAVSTFLCCATEKKYFQEFYHLQDSVAWIVGIFLSQSYFDPETLPTRIIFVSALSLALVLSNSYSAFIISSLATEFIPITTPKDLEKFSYRVISDERNSYTCEAIYTSNKTRSQYCGVSLYKNEEDSVQKMYRARRGKFAFVKSLDLIAVTAKSLGYSDDEICSASDIELPFKLKLTSMYGLKKSPLVSILNPKLLKVHERGVNLRYRKIFAKQTNVICSEKKFKYDPDIEISDVYIAFCVLLLGQGCVLSGQNGQKWTKLISSRTKLVLPWIKPLLSTFVHTFLSGHRNTVLGVIMSCFLCFLERWFLRISRRRKKGNKLHSHDAVKLENEYEINYTNWATKTSQYYYHYDN